VLRRQQTRRKGERVAQIPEAPARKHIGGDGSFLDDAVGGRQLADELADVDFRAREKRPGRGLATRNLRVHDNP
jgi:hypothetical protein